MTLSGEVRAGLQAAGQGHVLEWHDALRDAQQEQLGLQIRELDLGLLQRLGKLIHQSQGEIGTLEPPDIFPLQRSAPEEAKAQRATRFGHELMAQGKLAFVLVAGGQASRLGYDAPKGSLPIGPVTGRSLFSMHAARLAAARRAYGQAMPWYIMTSQGNDLATRDFFQEHLHFGLPKEDITFFSQKMQPALDAEGRLLFSSPSSLFLAPNGHGGCLLALKSSGALADMRERGIEYVSYFQVDNPLARPADPLFLGLHAVAGAGMSSKIVPKRDAAEKVGVIGLVEGKLQCIEYSDMSPEQLNARDRDGNLTFRAGNIAMHLFSLDFLSSVADGGDALPWHVAAKKLEVLDLEGARVEVPGYKFETFVFDALKSSPVSITLEVDRRLEFAPVKNKAGVDSPQSARTALGAMYARWVQTAGGTPPHALADGSIPLEVDPLLAQSEAEFLAADRRAQVSDGGGHYYGPHDVA